MSTAGDLSTVLRHSPFRRLLAVRLISQTGDGVFQLALASYVFFSPEKQPTAAKVAAVFATLLLPYSIVGPFAGVFIDRWRRQRILLVGNLVRATMVVCVALLVVGGSTDTVFLVATLAVLSVNRFFLSALSAALPHVVKYELLVMGNSLTTTSGTLAAVLGGGIGYGVRSLTGKDDAGAAVVMFAAAAVYLASSVCATTMDRDLLGPDREGPPPSQAVRNVLRDVAAGARHVWQQRRAGRALAAIAAHRFFYGISTIATVLLYRNYFTHGRSTDTDAGLAGLAAVFLASGAGYFVAALVTPVATRRFGEERWIVGLFGGAAVIEVTLGVPYRNVPYLVAAFFLGIVAQGSKITVDSVVQESIDDAFRGRVFSFYDILFNVSFVSAAAFGALALPSNGKSYAVLGFIAAGYVATALTYSWRTARSARPSAVDSAAVTASTAPNGAQP